MRELEAITTLSLDIAERFQVELSDCAMADVVVPEQRRQIRIDPGKS